ncbi:MAG: hypothetical protein A2808_01820 [Candidatus Moranbacteria bacterium RIFCSPHIGHO2_01_FULL_55_24]|nr:MAG: hypothetical protein A2808_01820 [Candidatus Moranbacteria bacterium RIFCSPHIGHO2_01_FULL_55_24]
MPLPNTLAHAYIVIMAGGSGTRLWPLSRTSIPKQFQSFTSEKTLLQETFDRVRQVVPTGQIFVSTTENYAPLVLEQIPEISQNHLILEPEARNTAPAIALIASVIKSRDADAVVATIASDHAIENVDEFVATIKAAFATVAQEPGKLVTVGINPTRADTGLGYIKMGKECAVIDGKRVFFIEDFKEKPDQKTAEQYLTRWEYLWNAGYFIFSADTFLGWAETFAPDLANAIRDVAEARESGAPLEKIKELYQKAPKEPVEPLIVEKLGADERLVIPSALHWSDVGNWGTLFDFLSEQGGSHIVTQGPHLDLESARILVHGKEKMIVTLGLEDVVIIDTPDAILIADKNIAGSKMKEVIEKLKETHRSELL